MAQKTNDSLLLNTVENILPFFSQLYFFNKLHKERKFKIVNTQNVSGLNKRGKEIVLNAQDFSLLWLIRALSTETHKNIPQPYCEQALVQKFYVWRRDPENSEEVVTANNRFVFLTKRLMAVNLIDYDDHPDIKRKHVIFLKYEGEMVLQDLREERIYQLSKIFSLVNLNKSEWTKLEIVFETMATEAWKVLHAEIRLGVGENKS